MSPCVQLSVLALALVFASVQCQNPRFRANEEDLSAALPACQEKEMDIYFILDSSSSIYYRDYDLQLQFVRDAVQRLDVSPRATRVGVLTFSDDFTRPTIGLDQYSDKSGLVDAINLQTLPYRTGQTNTHLAIRQVREDATFRQDITKVMVVVTDGGSRSPGQTAQEARLAREQGFYMFVVGVGQFLEESEWRSIASDPDTSFIFNITNYSFLDRVKDSLPPQACALPPIIEGGSCLMNEDADLFFVAAPGGTQEAMQLIDTFADKTTDDEGQLQVSYILDICDGGENVQLGNQDIYCRRDLPAAEATQETNKILLERAQTVARENREGGRTSNQVVVLFMNRDMISREQRGSYDMWRLMPELRSDGLEVVGIDLGLQGRQARFAGNLAGNTDNVVQFNQGSLVSQVQAQTEFVDKICAALNRQPEPARRTRPPFPRTRAPRPRRTTQAPIPPN